MIFAVLSLFALSINYQWLSFLPICWLSRQQIRLVELNCRSSLKSVRVLFDFLGESNMIGSFWDVMELIASG